MPNQRATGVTPRTVAFPDELWARAQRYADAHEVTVSVVVRDALEEFVRRRTSPSPLTPPSVAPRA